jgi:hypothetical protein
MSYCSTIAAPFYLYCRTKVKKGATMAHNTEPIPCKHFLIGDFAVANWNWLKLSLKTVYYFSPDEQPANYLPLETEIKLPGKIQKLYT